MVMCWSLVALAALLASEPQEFFILIVASTRMCASADPPEGAKPIRMQPERAVTEN